MNCLAPLSSQLPLRGTAVVDIAAASEPLPGSVRAQAAIAPPGGQRGDVLLLLFLAAEAGDGFGAQAQVGGQGDAGGGVGAGHFGDGDGGLPEAAAAAAVGRVDADAGQADAGHTLPVFPGKAGGFVQRGGARHQLPLGKIADEVLQHPFLFVEHSVNHKQPPGVGEWRGVGWDG